MFKAITRPQGEILVSFEFPVPMFGQPNFLWLQVEKAADMIEKAFEKALVRCEKLQGPWLLTASKCP